MSEWRYTPPTHDEVGDNGRCIVHSSNTDSLYSTSGEQCRMWWKISIDAWTPIPKWIPPETGGRDVKHYRIDGNWLVIESHIAEVIFRNRNEVHRSEALAAIEASGVVRVEVRDVTWWRDAHVLGLYLTDGDLAEYDTLMAWARERTR